ncbi:unnamed protein product [Phytophthora fragariaefolia]|uniref:Unnamed protein product n=1 Tax=Phytophthora fragariaefolia TaxID=1490495 RepID=A0A9W6Y6N0_9STRA|nr:unnamed protein product [Phytophthora fragariaefolia]
MEQFAHLPSSQQDPLNKLMSLLGPEGVFHLASQGPDAVNARLEVFSSYENALLEHLQQRMTTVTASTTPTTTLTNGPKPTPLMVSVNTFEGKEGESLLLWTRELEMAMGSALLKTTEQQHIALAIFKLGGRAQEWALTCGTSVETSFPTWEQLNQQLWRVFYPPNQAYRVRSRFLATHPQDGACGLRPRVANSDCWHGSGPSARGGHRDGDYGGPVDGRGWTEVFRTHPISFKEASHRPSNDKLNFKSSQLGWNASYGNPSSDPEPMDLSYAKDEEAQLLAAEQCRGIRRCFVCGDTHHLRADCPVRNRHQAPMSNSPASV